MAVLDGFLGGLVVDEWKEKKRKGERSVVFLEAYEGPVILNECPWP